MYAGGRAVEGVGIALCLATAPTLLQEIAHPRYRATVAGLCEFGPQYGSCWADQYCPRYMHIL